MSKIYILSYDYGGVIEEVGFFASHKEADNFLEELLFHVGGNALDLKVIELDNAKRNQFLKDWIKDTQDGKEEYKAFLATQAAEPDGKEYE